MTALTTVASWAILASTGYLLITSIMTIVSISFTSKHDVATATYDPGAGQYDFGQTKNTDILNPAGAQLAFLILLIVLGAAHFVILRKFSQQPAEMSKTAKKSTIFQIRLISFGVHLLFAIALLVSAAKLTDALK